jgi:hypothetical protein
MRRITRGASFFGATTHTLEEYLDLVFRKAPVIEPEVCKSLAAFMSDYDGWGTDFVRFARRIVGEVLAAGVFTVVSDLVQQLSDNPAAKSLRRRLRRGCEGHKGKRLAGSRR